MRHKKTLSRKDMLSQYVKRADIKSSGSPIYMDSQTTIESILQFNQIKVDGKSGDSDGNGNGSAPPPPPPPPPPDPLGIDGKICDPKTPASVIDLDDPETWGEHTGIHPHVMPLHFMGNTAATWNTLYTPQVGDFIVSPRKWIPPPGATGSIFQTFTPVQQANVTHRNTVWEVTGLYLTGAAIGTRRLVSNCIQGISWMCHQATATTPIWCSQHPPNVGPHNFESQCLVDPTCGYTPPTWICSGNSTAVDINNNPVGVWTCYDDGSGTGNTNQTVCQAMCVPPIPITYICSGSSTAIDINNNPVGVWTCYDDGSGTGNPIQTACQAACFPPIPVSYDCSGCPAWICSDPGTGGGQYTDANSGGNPGDGLAACEDDCEASWECSGPNGFVSTNPLVGTVPQWMCYDPCDGSGSYGFGTPGSNACTAACNPPPVTYSCSGPNGVTLAANTPPHPIFGMNIPPWECFDTGMGTGQFTGINALTDCETVCVDPSWDCDPVNFICTPNTTGNGYWNSSNGGFLACEVACYPETWKCHIPWQSTVGTCTLGFYSPPEYALEQDCKDACLIHVVDPHLTGEGSWNCDWTWGPYSGGPGPNYIGNCNPVTGTSGTYATKQDCLDACIDYQVFIDVGFTHPDTWDCHIPWKQTIGHCHLKTDGTGAYSVEQDCIDACVDLEIFIDTGLTADPCDDIIACPCGWEYAGGWGFPNPVTNPLPGYVFQTTDPNWWGWPNYYVNPGEKWCKHPDWDWFYNPANSSHINAILGSNDPPPLAIPAFVLPCAETQGLPNAYVGMTVGSGTGSNSYNYPPPPYGSGRQFHWGHQIEWPFDQAPSYISPPSHLSGWLKWENYTVVEINPGNPTPPLGYQPVAEPSTPCTWGGVPHVPPIPMCEETLACPCGFTPVAASWATWGWTCEWTENTPGGPTTIGVAPYKIDCHILGAGINDPNNVLPSNSGGVPSYCLDQWSLKAVNGMPGLSTSRDIYNATTGAYFKTITWDKATIFQINPYDTTCFGCCPTLACINAYVGQIGSAPWGTVPIGCNYIISSNTSASGCSQPC